MDFESMKRRIVGRQAVVDYLNHPDVLVLQLLEIRGGLLPSNSCFLSSATDNAMWYSSTWFFIRVQFNHFNMPAFFCDFVGICFLQGYILSFMSNCLLIVIEISVEETTRALHVASRINTMLLIKLISD
jgi:hypothetical protein